MNMSSIIEYLNTVQKAQKLRILYGSTLERVNDAEYSLGMKFASDYKEYTSKYGAVSLNGHELTGVCNVPRLNVEEVTKRLRIRYPNMPNGYYVLEETSMDCVLAIQREDGKIILWDPKQGNVSEYNNMIDYLEKS